MEEITRGKQPVNIEDEMRKSYLDYAMSVIIGRALPDVRDGLKPVHRRVLYAMYDTGNTHDKPYRKCAKVVGEVLGKYHPHGDAAVYDTLVRMAQDFSLRYPLIDGQGNFGSVDGDPAAAMRYTEARLARLAHEMLADIDKETVDFIPNYDGSEFEPVVLPTRLPNLLVNGSSGIAVGMATNIPPHNLGEIVDAIILQINNPDTSLDELMEVLPGPDFPTAGFLHGSEGIRQAYASGRGILQMRARVVIEPNPKKDRESIVVTELPYQVNKARLVETIAALVNDRKIDGITDIRDESDRDGIRVVLELRRGEVAQVILNNLYAQTQMQETFGVIFLAIANNQPRVFTLKEMLQQFIEHRKEVVVRRTQFELRQAENRAHILEGLKIALDNLDQVIALIRAAKAPVEAKEQLRLRFKLSDRQAQAILDMRLQRLTGLEREKILAEYAETLNLIERLKSILASDERVLKIIVEELRQLRKTYADPRRTEIVREVQRFSIEDMIADEEMVITCSYSGYVKRCPLSVYRAQRRGGKGRIGMTTRGEDFVQHLFVASTHDYILVFTNKGRVHWLKVHEIPQIGPTGKGKAIVNLLNLGENEKVAALLAVREFDANRYVVMATRRGVVKKTELSAYSNPRSGGIIALSIDEGDDVLSVKLSNGSQEIFLASSRGKSIRFPEGDVRPMGRAARGVRGMVLSSRDYLVMMEVLDKEISGEIMTVCRHGFGKRTPLAEYRVQSRGGKGIINIRVTSKNGPAMGVVQVTEGDGIMIITHLGKIIRSTLVGVSCIGRSTQGVRLIQLDEGDSVVSVVKLAERDEGENGNAGRSEPDSASGAELGHDDPGASEAQS
ncbi:MAG: DNA gyrase subunit A [Acidobacteriota bacterium]